MVYLGVILDSAFRASPDLKRVEKLLSIGDVFLSCVSQPVSSWLEFLGVLFSMIQLVPGGLLRMRSVASVGSDRSVSAGRVVAGNPRRSFLVARPRSLSARRCSGAGVPSARVMVRRLRRGLGGSLGRAVRFRPVGSGRRRALDRCTGALGDRECSQVVCSTSRRFLSGGLRRQFDSLVVSAEPRRDSFFFSVLHCSEDSLLGGGSVSGDFPTVYYGETQCASGRSFSPKPDLGLRVDAEAGGLQGFVQEVAGVNRPVCNISKSQMFHIFFSLP